MDAAATFPDWPAKRDELRRRLAARRPRHDHTGPLRTAAGAVVEPDGVAAALAARTAFLRLAGDVQPALLTQLAGAPLDEYDAEWAANSGPHDTDLALEDPEARRLHFHFMAGKVDSTGPTMAWARRWGFPVTFEPTTSMHEDARGVVRHLAASSWGISVAGFTLHCWRVLPLVHSEELCLVDLLTTASAAQDIDLGLAATLALPSATWDPQREDRASATKRITAELGRAVRADLGRIETEALRRTVSPPAKRTGLEHLAWLARYHFRHESFPRIARDAHVGRQAVRSASRRRPRWSASRSASLTPRAAPARPADGRFRQPGVGAELIRHCFVNLRADASRLAYSPLTRLPSLRGRADTGWWCPRPSEAP